MIGGIGVDIVASERFENWLADPGKVARFFNEVELRKCVGAGAAASLAVRFAAKEAFGKALGCGLSGISLRDIWVENEEGGRPLLKITGTARKKFDEFGGKQVHLSLSHDAGMAVAMVLVEVQER